MKLLLTDFFQLCFVRIHQRVRLNGANLHFIKRVNKISICGMRRWFNEYYHARIAAEANPDFIFFPHECGTQNSRISSEIKYLIQRVAVVCVDFIVSRKQ